MDLIIKGKTSKLKGFSTHPEGSTEGVLEVDDEFKIKLA